MSVRRLLLPVEVEARELRAKLLLSVHAAAAGWRVYIGKNGAVQALANHVPPSVYIDKNILPARAEFFDQVKVGGHVLLAWEEEAIGVFDYDFHVASKIHGDMLARVDRFLTWGDPEREAIARRHSTLSDRLVTTGNPRGDVLRPEYRSLLVEEAKQYIARFGDYVLVLGNFNRVNAPEGTYEDYVRTAAAKFRLVPEGKAFWLEALQHRRAVFEQFLAAVPKLAAALPDKIILIRPHPAENHDTWRQLEAKTPNIRVVYEGDAVTWIAGAAAVIHNGCTTGVEAYLMGRLPIAYKPVASAEYDIEFPNDLSLCVSSIGELLACVRAEVGTPTKMRFRDGDPAYSARRPRATSVIASTEGETASQRILDVCNTLAPPASRSIDDLEGFLSARESNHRSRTRLIAASNLSALLRGRLQVARRSRKGHSKRKLSALDEAGVVGLVQGYARLANVECPSVRLVSSELACIECK